LENSEKINIYQKLQKAREEFLACETKKSGKNNFGKGFKYFELEDIVPAATKIFSEIGLLHIFNVIDGGMCQLKIVDTENPDKFIIFEVPFIMSNNSQNDIQNLGATLTYLRRYLYLIALDVVEADAVDATKASEQKEKKVTAAKENIKKGSDLSIYEKSFDSNLSKLQKDIDNTKTINYLNKILNYVNSKDKDLAIKLQNKMVLKLKEIEEVKK
jgi:hypothetical protein